MKSLRYLLLNLSIPLLISSAAYAQEQLTACTISTKQQALADVQRRVTLMKIAASKADFINLYSYANGDGKGMIGLDSYLDSCKNVLDERGLSMEKALCDADCHVQRAQAWLFMISELPFLDSKKAVVQKIEKGNDINLLKVASQRGLAIVDAGLANLSRMNQSKTPLKGTGEDQTTTDTFRGFLQDQARLQAIKVRLLLAVGDHIYQNVSRTRVQTLKNRIGNVLGNNDPESQKGSELYQAETFYDQAFWIVQEAAIDMPKIGLQSEAFQLMSLKNEVEQRLTSVRKGFLFLNIDPEHFTTKTADELMNALQTNLKELENLETNIESIVKTWQGNLQDQGRRDIDNKRIRAQKDLEIDGYKIAGLASQAEQLQTRYSKLLTDSNLAAQVKGLKSDVLEKQAMLSQLEFELQQTKAEVSAQIEYIKGQADLELTALDKEAAADRRDNYKWLIDMTLTQYNLALQIKQFDSQIQDLSDQITMKSDETASLQANIESRNSLIKVELGRIQELSTVQSQIEARQGDVYTARRQALVQSICALLADKARYVGTAEGFTDVSGASCPAVSFPKFNDKEYWTSVITLRRSYLDPEADSGTLIEAYKKLHDCLTEGKQCDGKPGEIELINKVLTAEKEVWDNVTAKQLEQLKKEIGEHRDYLKAAQAGITTANAALAATNLTLGAAWTVGAGKILGFMMQYDVGAQLQAGYEVAMSGLRDALEAAKYGVSMESEMRGLSQKISDIDKELATVQAGWDRNIRRLQADQAIVAITGRRLEMEQGRETLKAEYALAISDAEHLAEQADAIAKRIDAEVASLKAQLDEARGEKELLLFDVEIANKQIDQANFRVQSLNFEISGLNSQKSLVEKDAARLQKLKQAAADQKNMTKATLESIDGLSKNVTSESQIVADLRDKQKAGQTALSAVQIKRLDEVLVQKVNYTTQAKDAINSQIDLLKSRMDDFELTKNLSDGFASQLDAIQGQVVDLNKSLVEKASLPDETAGSERSLFLATEDMVADLTQGIPDFMMAKRRRLQYTNMLFNLFRNRINTLYTIGDQKVPIDLVSYITSSADLSKAMENLCTSTDGSWTCNPNKSIAFSEASVVTQTSEFNIPANSGLMSRLLNQGRVRFQITPDVMSRSKSQDDAMASSGYFMLWDDDKMSSQINNSLINISVSGSFANKTICRNSVLLQVKHLGTGVRFNTMGSGSDSFESVLIARAPIAQTFALFDSDLDTNAYKYYIDYFGSPFQKLRSFPETIPHHLRETPVTLDYLGYPLVGDYEISFATRSPKLQSCLSGGALRIGFVYTSTSDK